MVPGMTERDRLVSDMQRLEWLSDAVLGPARFAHEPTPPSRDFTGNRRPVPPLGVWLSRFLSALVPGKRLRLKQS